MSKLEDIFAGYLELTASERAYIISAITEFYVRGAPGWMLKEPSRGAVARSAMKKLHALKLTKMVTPDGTQLVTREEHDAIVAKLYPESDE